ncbi:Gfo/Idh/MocA family oxidoreductase [Candidatus Gottesmanbacteria bacterium]|nr:Gfo/Idh/MocA family oxidoreductase [Candidatus Gottesmanbacteria bacterium]
MTAISNIKNQKSKNLTSSPQSPYAHPKLYAKEGVSSRLLNIGLIGFGYWGPNILRNFLQLSPEVRVKIISDINPVVLKDIKTHYPSIQTTSDSTDVLHNPDIDAVAIVTPVSTHFSLAKNALQKGKHVLIEKPMTITSKDSVKLTALAHKNKKILMVDHTFLYTPAVEKMKEIVDSGDLGTIITIDTTRTNLGLLQKDTNVIYDLACHDLSIVDFILGTLPISVSATGMRHEKIHQESVAHLSLWYQNNVFVHSHVSWLSPIKIRMIVIIGTKKMLVYDDMQPSEKIKIYDKSVSVSEDKENLNQLRIGYRTGDAVAPNLAIREGLAGVTEAFYHACISGKKPITDGENGTRIVRILEAATTSIRSNGKTIRIEKARP